MFETWNRFELQEILIMKNVVVRKASTMDIEALREIVIQSFQDIDIEPKKPVAPVITIRFFI